MVTNLTSRTAQRGAVTVWSKALLLREKINENQNIPGLTGEEKIFKFPMTAFLKRTFPFKAEKDANI